MRRKFGQTLRRLRTEARKSMGQLARHLGVSVTYISDVERGNRAPLTVNNIVKAAEFFKIDPQPLLEAAVEWHGHVELEVRSGNAKAHEVGVSLMRSWENLQDQDLEEIEKILNKRDKLFMFSYQHEFPTACPEDTRVQEKEWPELCFLNDVGIRRTNQ